MLRCTHMYRISFILAKTKDIEIIHKGMASGSVTDMSAKYKSGFYSNLQSRFLR